ncbi:hypothetical protein RFI_18665 [Reticulomyxa filosa]|uniref:Uncharacterized protein n=1 Tax=Reticulomyxa filosa TaxID=46433 RepID=X6MX49_RETFI|nr:hypothetical protein RFI_18665 [Reticulomyxa filosa]|eukprot:ETO18600.1 hypothetical protein RFI_18665 [Reticulomyxa filosa]
MEYLISQKKGFQDSLEHCTTKILLNFVCGTDAHKLDNEKLYSRNTLNEKLDAFHASFFVFFVQLKKVSFSDKARSDENKKKGGLKKKMNAPELECAIEEKNIKQFASIVQVLFVSLVCMSGLQLIFLILLFQWKKREQTKTTKMTKCLAKIGDAVCINSSPNCISFSTINENELAHLYVKFEDRFFHSYNYSQPRSSQNNSLRNNEEGSQGKTANHIRCKIKSKLLLSVFRVINNIRSFRALFFFFFFFGRVNKFLFWFCSAK